MFFKLSRVVRFYSKHVADNQQTIKHTTTSINNRNVSCPNLLNFSDSLSVYAPRRTIVIQTHYNRKQYSHDECPTKNF